MTAITLAVLGIAFSAVAIVLNLIALVLSARDFNMLTAQRYDQGGDADD